jgi:dihydrofolate reductase
MSTRKMVLFIAMSLDGFIADEKGEVDWLKIVDRPREDYGYQAFMESVDTVILGRKTYDKVLSFAVPFPHSHKKCYVLSRQRTGSDKNVEYYKGEVKDLLGKIRKEEGKDIFCDGGADTIDQLIAGDLIDRYILSIVPVLLGNGLPLFSKNRTFQSLQLKKSISFESGLVQLEYERFSDNEGNLSNVNTPAS